MRLILASVFALISYMMFITGEDVKCNVKMKLTSDRMLQVANQDEFCSCLNYKVAEKTSTSAEPCEVETRTVGGMLAIGAENICVCAGYETNTTKKEIIPFLTLTTKKDKEVLVHTKEINDSYVTTEREETFTSAHITDIPRINEPEIHLIESTTIDTIIGKATKEEIIRPTNGTKLEIEMMPLEEYMSNTTEEIEYPKTEIPDLVKCVSLIDNSTIRCNDSKDISDSSKVLTLVIVSPANDTTDYDSDKLTVNITKTTKSIDTINPINKTLESKLIIFKKDPISPDNVTDTTVVNVMSKDTNKTFEIIKPTEFMNVTENPTEVNVTSGEVTNKTSVHSKSNDYDYKYYINVFSLNKTIVVDVKTETTTTTKDPNDDMYYYEDESLKEHDKEKTGSVIHIVSAVETEKTVEATTTNIPISKKQDKLSVDSKQARENFLKVLVIVLLSILVVTLIVVVILNIIYSCNRRGTYAVAQVAERNIEMETKR